MNVQYAHYEQEKNTLSTCVSDKMCNQRIAQILVGDYHNVQLMWRLK